jgi:hypothetical protein
MTNLGGMSENHIWSWMRRRVIDKLLSALLRRSEGHPTKDVSDQQGVAIHSSSEFRIDR